MKANNDNGLACLGKDVISKKGQSVNLMTLNFLRSTSPTKATLTCFLDIPINFIPFKDLINIHIHFRIKRTKQKEIISNIVNMDDFTLLDWINGGGFGCDESNPTTVQPRNLWFGLLEIYDKDWFKYNSMIPQAGNKWSDDHISQNSKVIMELLLTFNNTLSKRRGITFTFVDNNCVDDKDGFQYFFGLNKTDFSSKNFTENKKWHIALQSLAKDIIELEQIEWKTDLFCYC